MIKSKGNSSHWSTAEEIRFLGKLGTCRECPGDRQQLLRNYKAAMKNRKDWGAIIVEEVREYLKEVM